MTDRSPFFGWRGVKIMVFIIWVVLVGLLARRDVFITSVSVDEQMVLDRAASEEYQGVYFRDDKIGYVISRFSPGEPGRYTINQEARMDLKIGETSHRIDLLLDAVLGKDNTLQTFSFRFDSPFYQMSADGHTEGSAVLFTLTTGNSTIENRLELDEPPMLPTARRHYLLRQGLTEGEKIRIPWFDPVSLTAKSSVVEYRGKDRLLIHGRVHNLHKFIENYGGARVSLWLNDEGDVIKEQSPAGFVFIKEPKFRALAVAESSEDLLAAVAVKFRGKMPPLEGLETISYRLGLPEDVEFDLDGPRQKFTGDLLTVTRESVDAPETGNGKDCLETEDMLAASAYVQADAADIQKLAKELTDTVEDQLGRVRVIADWVYNNLEKRPVIGIPDALSTLRSGQGDCNEHAALFAALARSAGIPTRIAVGVVYHKKAFYYHAWNEVCVEGSWVSLDTTTNQLPADVSHIRFLTGELDEQVRIGGLIGRLDIEPITGNPGEKSSGDGGS